MTPEEEDSLYARYALFSDSTKEWIESILSGKRTFTTISYHPSVVLWLLERDLVGPSDRDDISLKPTNAGKHFYELIEIRKMLNNMDKKQERD